MKNEEFINHYKTIGFNFFNFSNFSNFFQLL